MNKNIINRIVDRFLTNFVSNKNKWVYIQQGRKDMPKCSKNVLCKTVDDKVFIGYWSTHDKAVFYNNIDIFTGKFVRFRFKKFRNIKAWSEIPEEVKNEK